MKISQRVARSEIHFYLQKLEKRGYKKVLSSHHKGGYCVVLERTGKEGKVERLNVKFSTNGWCTIS